MYMMEMDSVIIDLKKGAKPQTLVKSYWESFKKLLNFPMYIPFI